MLPFKTSQIDPLDHIKRHFCLRFRNIRCSGQQRDPNLSRLESLQ